MTTLIILLIVALLFLVAFVLLRTLFFRAGGITPQPLPEEDFYPIVIASALGAAIRCRTVSDHDAARVDPHPFLQIKLELEKSFPRVHRTLQRIDLGTPSLLFHWRGSQPDLNPIVLTGHLDVVAVDPSTESQWHHPPFGGEVADGYIWGRGAVDCKGQVIAILQAVEHLVGNGFKPSRSIYLAFGHDEETSGTFGAPRIAAWMKSQNIHPEFVLDEGTAVVSDFLPGVKIPAGLIGVAEKGYLTIELSSQAKGGHSAMPPASTAIGSLASAITRLEKKPFPAHPQELRELFRRLGSNAPFLYQLVFANLWLFAPLAARVIGRIPEANASIRTTLAATVIHGGVQENVLPQTASALLNLRLFPGDSVAYACERIRKVIADPGIQLQALEGRALEATIKSPSTSNAYHAIERISAGIFGNIPLVPVLIAGMTDARFYTLVSDNVYRFTPLRMTPEDLSGLHGVNERISVEGLVNMARFYYSLLQVQAGEKDI
jgi:carboxypeptidase PM20D1